MRVTQMVGLATTLVVFACSDASDQRGDGPIADTDGGELAQPKDAAPNVGAKIGLGPRGPQILIGTAARGERLEPNRQPRWDELLVAVDTPYQIFEGQGTYVHVAAWMPDGNPAPQAAVFVGDQEVGTTDAHGALVFIYPPRGGKATSVGPGAVSVVVGTRCGTVPFSPNVRTPSFASDHLFVYTDRGVYRPGETIHVRSIGWHLEEDYGPLAGSEVEYALRSAAGATIRIEKQKTDDFGVSALDWSLPATAAEGLYHLEVAHAGERQSARLQVKDFKPPRIRIDHTLGRFITADQETLTFEVTLTPGGGAEFGAGTVTLSARAEGRERAKVRQKVTGPGPHVLTLSQAQLAALKSGLSDGVFAKMVLSVRDDKGVEASLDREMRFANNPYVAVIEADRDQYATGDPVELIVKLSDLDGAPVRDRDLSLRLSDRAAPLTARTDGTGYARFSFKMGSATLSASVYTEGVSDPIATSSVPWGQPRPMRSALAEPVVREGGDVAVTVQFPADFVPVSKVVHLDVVDTSGAIVEAVLLRISGEDGKPIARGTFRAPSWGSMLLTFFTIGRSSGQSEGAGAIGLLVEGQSLPVKPNRELTVVLDGFPENARPGDPLRAQASVRGPGGEPVNAAVGAALVDGRVLALKDPLEITPMDRFYNPELRTMSVTGSKILTWPVVSRNWGSRQRDVALPHWPFLDGGPANACFTGSGPRGGYFGGKSDAAKGGGGSALQGIAELFPGEPAAEAEAEPAAAPPPPPKKKRAKGADNEAPDDDARPRAESSKTEITIRTRLPDTSLWAPRLRASGSVTIEGTLPQTTGPQELIVIASDKAGGVGLARETISLEQPLYAEANFPPRLPAGATVSVPVTVYNATGKSGRFEVALVLGSDPPAQTGLEIKTGSSGFAALQVKPDKAGVVEAVLTSRGAGFEDIAKRSIRVVPAAVPERVPRAGRTIAADTPFEDTFEVASGDISFEAFVRVSFPAVATAFVGAEELAARLTTAPTSLGAGVLSSVLVLRYAEAHKLAHPRLALIRRSAMAALGDLLLSQRKDGGFSYWRNRKTSVYVTAYVLEALLEARELGLVTDDSAITRAANFLARAPARKQLARPDAIAFWEGETTVVRTGVTADVFAVLSSVPVPLRSPTVHKALEWLSVRFAAAVKAGDLGPFAAGRAIEALVRLEALEDHEALRALAQLMRKRDTDHWEPTWFHAYGGTIEASVAILRAAHQLSASAFAVEKRDALRYILATREAWGAWHNERGTSAAIRALLLLGPPPSEAAATVTVEFDGKTVETVAIDPTDPVASAARLAHVSLGEAIAAGKHSVRVRYDGTLQPTAEVVTTRYVGGVGASAAADGHGLDVGGPARLRIGDEGQLTVRYQLAGADRVATILLPAAAAFEVATDNLERSLDKGTAIADYRITEHGVSILVRPGAARGKIQIPIRGVRAGVDPAIVGLRAVRRDGRDTVTLAASAGPLNVD